MINILKKYIENNMEITEYTQDGETISHVIKTSIPQEIILTFDEVKSKKNEELQKLYYASFTTFQSDALDVVKTYPIDKEAQDNLKDYQNRLIADTNKDSFYFKTIEDGTLILHNRQQFLKLMEDAEMFKVNQTIKLNDLINQVNLTKTKEELDLIVW
jgi:hypothetical protein